MSKDTVTIHLVLTRHWYDKIAAGPKRVEYRKMSDHWKRLIWDRRESVSRVRFSRGYTKITLEFDVTKIDIGPCPYDGWDDTYYRIYF